MPKEEEAKIEEETREYFDGLAPKRHTKPQRSEHSSKYVDDHTVLSNSGAIPEYVVFQQLEHDSQVPLFYQLFFPPISYMFFPILFGERLNYTPKNDTYSSSRTSISTTFLYNKI